MVALVGKKEGEWDRDPLTKTKKGSLKWPEKNRRRNCHSRDVVV